MSAEQPEIWKAIPGYEGAYEVSDLGRVRSLDRTVYVSGRPDRAAHWRECKGRILRPGPQLKSGHLSVCLERGVSSQVHALVLLAFVGPRPEGQECLHWDDDPSNNRLTNLRYGTRSQNLVDIFYQKGRTLNREQVLHIRRRHREGFVRGERARLIEALGTTYDIIAGIATGRYYAHVA